jgi:hypothetical protein
LLHFTHKNETDVFVYDGPNFTAFGGEVSAGPYAIFGFNMYEASDYKGISQAWNGTLARGPGITVGYFWSGDRPLQPGDPQGFIIGYSPGIAASLSYSEPTYHPFIISQGY